MTIGCPQQTGNWVGMQCRGLATVAILFHEWPESSEWLKVALDRLSSELAEGKYPDGGQKELAPAYHHVAFRDFFEVFRLLNHNKLPVSKHYEADVRSMFAWMKLMASPDGHLPPLGDSPRLDISETLAAGRAVFPNTPDAGALADLPDSGYFVFRSQNIRAVFDAGPLGAGHWHEDCLSLYLEAFGAPLVTDPGKYNYDASIWRYYAVGTPSHNTVTVDGKWQRRGGDCGAPGPLANSCHSHSVSTGEGWVCVRGIYTGPYISMRHTPVPWESSRNSLIH